MPQKLIRVGNDGNVGNRMFQLMYCINLADLVPGAVVSGYDIKEFGLLGGDDPMIEPVLHAKLSHKHPMDTLAFYLNNGYCSSIQFNGYAQRVEYIKRKERFKDTFRVQMAVDASISSDTNIIVNVRGGEILGGVHPDYGPVPIDWVCQAVEDSKRTPILMGQIGDNYYSNELLKRFEGCTVIPHRSAIEDFETIRAARNVVLSVSSFSWVAAWLSAKTENIYMPMSGFFNQRQRPDINLVPLSDERYHFYDLPLLKWTAAPNQIADILGAGKRYRELTQQEVAQSHIGYPFG